MSGPRLDLVFRRFLWAPNPETIYIFIYFSMFSISPRSLMDKALLTTQRSWIQETCLRRFCRIPHTSRQNFVTDITLRSHIARNRTAQSPCTATLHRFTAQWRVRFPVAAPATNSNYNVIIYHDYYYKIPCGIRVRLDSLCANPEYTQGLWYSALIFEIVMIICGEGRHRASCLVEDLSIRLIHTRIFVHCTLEHS